MVLFNKIKDLVDYIISDPDVVWSGAARKYRKVYRRYLNTCRCEFHDAQIGIYNKELIQEKYVLASKLDRLKKALTSSKRNRDRLEKSYINFKVKQFGNKLDKF